MTKAGWLSLGRQVVGPDLVIRTAVYFVAHTKDHGSIEIVSIRLPNPRSAQSSLVKLPVHRAPVEPLASEPTLDRDTLDALAWIESGMSDGSVGYGPDAPQLTPEQLGELALASYVPVSESVPV